MTQPAFSKPQKKPPITILRITTILRLKIIINSFGKENTDYIDNKSFLACISKVYKSIPTLLEKIHFDPNKSQIVAAKISFPEYLYYGLPK